jgi:hypothetical protein
LQAKIGKLRNYEANSESKIVVSKFCLSQAAGSYQQQAESSRPADDFGD